MLPFKYWHALCKYRTCNHKLPIETGRYNGIPRQERLCSCSDKLGDEFHFLFQCTHLNEIRTRYLDIDYVKSVNTFSFNKIMNSRDYNVIFNLAKFINEGFNILK